MRSVPLGAPADRYKTIFFDLGDTLASAPSPLDIWLAAASEREARFRRDTLARALKAADETYGPRVYEYHGRMEEFWELYDRFVTGQLKLPDGGRSLAKTVEESFLDTRRWFRPYPETHSVLSELKQRGVELGIISNSTDEMIDRLNDLDLLRYFDTLTYSQEAGAEKPAPEPFRLALKRARQKPERCLHVGNSYEQDVLGARGAGIEPLLVDRKGKYPNPDCPVVKDLRGVLGEG